MRHYFLLSLLAAIGATMLFIAVFSLGLGFIFLFLPSLPLFALGMRHGARPLLLALAMCVLALLLFGSPSIPLVFLAYLGLPVLLLAPRIAEYDVKTQAFPPMGVLLSDLCIYAALACVALELHLAATGGIQGLIATEVQAGLAELDPALQSTLTAFAGSGAFFMVGVMVWWWLLLIYAHAFLANQWLKSRKAHRRENLALTPFNVPQWMLVLLPVLGLASLADGAAAFLAKLIFIIFLLPYFFAGVSVARERMKEWPGRSAWLFMLYALSLVFVWPALVLVAMGIWEQCKTLRGIKP